MSADVWTGPRSPASVMVLLEIAEQQGIDHQKALRGTGLSIIELADPELELHGAQELAVIRNLVRATHNRPGLGTLVGTRATVGMLGVWGVALTSCRTLREVVEVALRYGYGKFSWVFLRPWVDQRPDALHTVFDATSIPDDVLDFMIERDVAFVASLVPTLFGPSLPFRIFTTLTGDRAGALVAAFRRYDVRVGCDRNSIAVPHEHIDAPVPTGNEHALRLSERQCQQLVERFRPPETLTFEVEALLLRWPDGQPSLGQAAEELGMHPRTLSRQLEAEGTTFRVVADRVRRRMAHELLADEELTVQQISEQLGFADAASFSRAHKRWTGESPGAARKHLAPEGATSGSTGTPQPGS